MVERFELDFHGLYGEDAYMAKAENGELVRYSDYADLEAKLAAVHDRAKQAAAMCEAGYGVSAYNVATSILSALEPAAPEDKKPVPVTTVYEPYPGAFDDILGPATRPSEQAVTEAQVKAALNEYISGDHDTPEEAMRAALKAAMEAGR